MKTPPKDVVERKGHFNADFKLAEVNENCFSGVANMLGIMDRGGDVMAPGSFPKACLQGFLSKGFIALGHDWSDNPIAMPVDARESATDGMKGLTISAEFHSTQAAQDARTVVKERMEKNLFCGLSIGFTPDRESVEYFENGAALWKMLEDNDLTSNHDPKTIKPYKYWCRYVRKVAELYEVSIVTVPMNQMSGVTAAKSADPAAESETPAEITAPEEDMPAVSTFEADLDSVLAAVEGLVVRAKEISDLRGVQGREIGELRKGQIREVGERVTVLGSTLAELSKSSPKLADEAARLRCEADNYAALAGV